MDIKQIETHEQYKDMLALVKLLMNADKDSLGGKQLELAASFIEAYEQNSCLSEEDRLWLGSSVGKEKEFLE